MNSEITEEKDEKEDQKQKIRQIIEHQKSLYWSCSSSSSSSSHSMSTSSISCSSSRQSSSLFDLMKNGNTSLRRLLDMSHTSLATHLHDYSGSPVTRPIPLWGSDMEEDDERIVNDPWESINDARNGCHGTSNLASDAGFFDEGLRFKNMRTRLSRRKLTRKKSYKKLPGFWWWRCRRFSKFRLRLKKQIRIMICGKMF